MTQPDLFGGLEVTAKPARDTPLGDFLRPVYTKYDPKYPSRCDRCVEELHEAWRDGTTPYTPPKTARTRRVLGGDVLLLCSRHTQEMKEKEGR